MPPERAARRPAVAPPRRRLRLVPPPRLRVVDVALFYGERSGGIRTYLDAKRAHAQATGGLEHHVVVPGPRERHEGGWHELPSLRLAGANGYRLPLGIRSLRETLARLAPDVVLLHDPFWGPVNAAATAHRAGARVVAVHHGTSDLSAAGLPGPTGLQRTALRRWLRRAYRDVDAVMSAVPTEEDAGRPATLPLGLGVGPQFRPRPEVARRDHVLYAGRLAREKGVMRLLDAAALGPRRWPLRLIGDGPLEDRLVARAERLGIADRVTFQPFVKDREALARRFAAAGCVVLPGEHETFGLSALEAAAAGARVVTCATAPSSRAAAAVCHTFAPGDTAGLARAVDAALAAPADLRAAAAISRAHRWEQLFDRELRALGRLLR